jgi:hypothetical protein
MKLALLTYDLEFIKTRKTLLVLCTYIPLRSKSNLEMDCKTTFNTAHWKIIGM